MVVDIVDCGDGTFRVDVMMVADNGDSGGK